MRPGAPHINLVHKLTPARLTQLTIPSVDGALLTAKLLRIESDLISLIHSPGLDEVSRDRLRLALSALSEVGR